jgi:hypothetical protein
MDAWSSYENKCDGNEAVRPGTKDIYVQLVISLVLGLTAFITFCVGGQRILTHFFPRKRGTLLTRKPCRSYDHDGRPYMPLENDTATP